MTVFDFIYVEEAVRDCERAREICRRFPAASVVGCDRYGEIFNRSGQNFRLQKRNPALILAARKGRRVLPAPPGYGIGSNANFYFSHMLNCVYDCRYCFLQGMYRSAHMVVFVNYGDFKADIEGVLQAPDSGELTGEPHFFTGYDCDSLALEGITGFVEDFLPFFAAHPEALFELRTKSVRTAPLKSALGNVVVAYSLNPAELASHESGVPPVRSRIAAAARLQEAGWPVGLRFDPLIWCSGFHQSYRRLFAETFDAVRGGRVHSVSLGTLRLPRPFHRRMEALYPEEALLARGLEEAGRETGYPGDLREEMLGFCLEELRRYVPEEVIFPCPATGTEAAV